VFAKEGMALWISGEFAGNSYVILQILAVGALINSIGYIPFAFLDGIGRPDITAKVQVIELPFYILLMWFSIKEGGIIGAAFACSFRTAVDSVILWFFAQKLNPNKLKMKINLNHLWIIILILLSFIVIAIDVSVYYKLIASVVILSIFLLVSWHSFLQKEEKDFIISRLMIFNKYR